MHTTVKLEGVMDLILTRAVKSGLAKTKVEALRLGVVELNNRYSLVRDAFDDVEDAKDSEYIRKARARISSGKMKLLGEKELNAALGR